MKQPIVSVIVTTKNSESTLSRCLESVIHQDYSSLEIIVVDNYSVDATREIARKYTKHVFSKGPERSAQRNYAIKKAKGTYLYFIDADFILEQTVVTECMAKIHEGYDAVIVHNSPDTSISWIAKIRKFEVDMYKFDLTHSAARFFNREVFELIGGYTEGVTAGEDYDIQNKLNRKGFRTGFIESEALHIGEPTSIRKHLKKYYDYGTDFVHYKAINEQESNSQLGFVRSIYLKHWKQFFRHPGLGITFLVYHVAKFSAGGMGFVVAKLGKKK